MDALLEVSSPLLKFRDDRAFLHEDGLAAIDRLPGLVYPVILMGDGRAGKSYLASRLLGLEEAFVSSDSAEPVTEGIDCVVFPMAKLLGGTPGFEKEAAQAAKEQMHMLLLDCEGGNNAMAAIRTIVNVFGTVIGTEVVFVAGGCFSEAALQNLGACLAARSLIKLETGSRLPEQRLVFVVNKNTLRYDSETLEKALKSEQADRGRHENRQLVLQSFSERRFFSIPLIGTPSFEDSIAALRDAVLRDMRPLKMGGLLVRSSQLSSLLQLIVSEMRNMNEISFPSMSRCVVLDGFLRPIAKKLFAEAQKGLATLADYDERLDAKDPRMAKLAAFDREAAHITDKAMVSEAREELETQLASEWAKVRQINDALGGQTKDTCTETQEIPTMTSRIPLGGRGLLSKVTLMQQTVRLETRTKITKKDGAVVYTEWEASGLPAQRIVESAFHNFSTAVPSLMGALLKKSPSILKTVVTFGAGVFQERMCVVKEGHILWWDKEKTTKDDQEVSGAINFLINKAVCEVDPESPNIFVIRPSQPSGWSDAASFSGGARRELIFNVLGSQYTREQWVAAVRRNIVFADLAAEQLGVDRLKSEVGCGIPLLYQATYNARR